MRREILFRGKEINNGKWKYGGFWLNTSLVKTTIPHIIDSDGITHEVDSATVGQYTGLIDKNGVKIFEGDQLEFVYHESYFKGVVYFVDGSFYLKRNSSDIIVYTHLKDAVNKLHAYVIGNIYDSPENIVVDVNDSVEEALQILKEKV